MNQIRSLLRLQGLKLFRLTLTVFLLAALSATAFGSVPDASGAGPTKDKTARHTVKRVEVAPKRELSKPQQRPSNAKPIPAVNPALAGTKAVDPIDLKVLVISADGNETDFPAVKAFLEQIGIPYDTLIATQRTLTPSMLWDGNLHGYYQGIILMTGSLVETGKSTLTFDENEWKALYEYESRFGIRQVTSYTVPGVLPETYGMSLVGEQDTTNAPISASLTTAGKAVFPYLNTSSPITIRNAWAYFGTVVDSTVTTPLLVYTDNQGRQIAIASITKYSDGRENLAVTVANNPYLLHSMLLSYGVINWVTKGLFLGERHVNLDVQVDDILVDSDIWNPTALNDTSLPTARMTGSDVTTVVNWQNKVRSSSTNTSGVKLEMAFNGEGAFEGMYTPDTLTPAIKANQSRFSWVNHTYNHENLDAVTYTSALSELNKNHSAATKLKLTSYFKDALVQPDISGLYNSEFLRAAKDFGLKYLISDTSRPEWNNPSPNAGFYSSSQPSILIIPRRPTNLFYNVKEPAEWVSEYNCYYSRSFQRPPGTCADGAWAATWGWDNDLTYDQILEKESDVWLQYLLKWDLDPLMFHQANLISYDGTRSLLGDLLDKTLAKYKQVYNLPVRNMSQHEVGIKMANRMAYNNSGVRASMVPCKSLTITTTKAAIVPVTGVATGSTRETYGGQNISYLSMGANSSKTIALPACQ